MFKKSVSYYLFIASLLGVIVATAHTLGIAINFGISKIIGIILMLGLFLIWYSKLAITKAWARLELNMQNEIIHSMWDNFWAGSALLPNSTKRYAMRTLPQYFVLNEGFKNHLERSLKWADQLLKIG